MKGHSFRIYEPGPLTLIVGNSTVLLGTLVQEIWRYYITHWTALVPIHNSRSICQIECSSITWCNFNTLLQICDLILMGCYHCIIAP